MSGQLRLQVLLSAVDKITRPLRDTGEAAKRVSQNIRGTQGRIRELNDQAKRVAAHCSALDSLQTTNRELNSAQQRAQQLSREFRNAQNPTRAMAREMKSAQADVRRLRDQKESLTRTAREQRSALQQSGVNTRNLAQESRNLRQQTDQATQALARQKRELQQVNDQTRRLANARKAYDQTMQFRGQLAGVGARSAAGGTAALYAGSRLMAPGMDFDATMSVVQSRARLERDSAELAALRAQARNLGATTSFTATDVGEGQAFLAMAGFDPKDIEAAMPGMLNLSRAGDVALGRTADIASNMLSAFGLLPSEMSRMADVLTATTTRANVDLNMLGATMNYMAPNAALLGISLEESAAMAGLLGNIGIQGSQAGTTLREIFNRLVSQTGPAAEAMEQLELKTKDADGNMRAIPSILQDVMDATKDMGTAERAGILAQIFGTRAGAGISELVKQQGEGAIQEFVNILESSAGEAARVSSVMADNAKGDMQSLRSAWEDVGIQLFETNDTGIRELIQNITEVVRSVGSWMKENPELVRTITMVAGATAALAAVGGTLALTIAGLLGPFAMMKYATTVLGIKILPMLGAVFKGLTAITMKFGAALMATPIGWVIAGIAGIVAAVILVRKYWEPLTAFFKGVGRGIIDGLSPVFDSIRSMTGGFKDVFAPIMPALQPVIDMFKGFGSVIKSVAGWFSGLLTPVESGSESLQKAGSAGEAFGRVLAAIIKPAIQLVTAPFKILGGLARGAMSIMDRFGVTLGDLFKWSPLGLMVRAFGGAVDWLRGVDWRGAASRGWDVMKTIYRWSPLGLMTRGFSAASEWLGQIDWAGRASQAWDLMKTVFKWSPLGLIVQGFSAVLDWIREVDWHGAAAEAWELMKTIFKWSPLGLIVQGWQSTFEFFGGLRERFSGFGADILNGLMGGITGKLAEVRDRVTGAAESVAGWFKDKLGISSPSKVFQQYGDDTMNGLAIGLGDNAEPIKEMDRNIDRLKAAAAGTIMLGAVAAPVAAGDLDSPVAYAEQQQQINQVVEPARMVQMPNGTMIITQELQSASLPEIEDATRTIRERVESAGMPDNSDVIRRINTDEQAFVQQRAQVSKPSPQLTQQFSTEIAPGAIVIQAAPGQSPQDIAREVARQIEERDRRAAARERSRFADLE